MTKKKFYAVAVGRTPGIYSDWPAAEAQVKGFAGAKFKGFASRVEADEWLEDPVYSRRLPGKQQEPDRQVADIPSRENGVAVYTDGGCINNPGPGGYGIVIVDGVEIKERSGGFRLTTNNRMELMACLVALQELEGTVCAVILLHSDSRYVVNGIEKGWAKGWRARGWRKSDGQPALNADLWADLLRLSESLPVTFRWVKGHAGNIRNERCDTLATTFARQKGLPIDTGYEEEK